MKKVAKFVLKRLKEKSTLMGLVSFVGTVVGVSLAPELKEQIVTAGVALSGAGLMLLTEGKDDEDEE